MSRYSTYSELDDRIGEDLEAGFIGFNNRLRPDQLSSGILFDSQNGRMNQNGEWQTRKGIDNIKAPLSTGSASLTLPFTLIPDDASITVTQTGNKLIITDVDVTNFTSLNIVQLAGITGISPDPNGFRVAKRDSASQLTIEDQTYTGTAGGTDSIKYNFLSDTSVNEVYGSCIFSDPNDESESYIILAANTKAIAIKVSDPSTSYDLTYPSGETISSSVEMIQAFNKLIIFREGDTPFEKDLASTNISSSPALTKVSSGTYTQPIPISITDLDIASGIATATVSSTATLKRGDTATITATNSTIAVNTVITVDEVTNSTTFTFFTNVADQTNKTATIEKPMSQGLGFTHMPAPKYGVYHQRRLAVPYRYSVSASSDTYADRKIFDEILISDILDTDTYDQVYGQFRFNAGKSDFNVGMLSFSDDKLIVFNRNSIHIVVGNGDLSGFQSQLLTDEIGLTARNSVIQVGNQILFLSDNGVYGLSFVDLYNLRGNEIPLSGSIQKTIDTINKAHVDKASAVYFDNKYYLAIPTGTSTVNNTLIIYNFLNKNWESIDNVNNVDISGSTFSSFEFTKLLVAGNGSERGVYVTNTDGGIHKLEVFDDGIDRVITGIGITTETQTRVQGSASTRMFTLGSIDRKKFKDFEIHLESSADDSSDLSITATTENLDSELNLTPDGTVGSTYGPFKNSNGVNQLSIPAGEDVSVRGRIGNKRSYGLQITLISTLGRPRFRSLRVSASEAFRSTSSVQ
tara:strand:+ start:292 stop:2529 length:2238 start_codon:yes stop_codon:yes gene_type:complete